MQIFPFPVFTDFVKKLKLKTWFYCVICTGIAFVENIDNPPNAPLIRPIEIYWGILKMKNCKGNWTI